MKGRNRDRKKKTETKTGRRWKERHKRHKR